MGQIFYPFGSGVQEQVCGSGAPWGMPHPDLGIWKTGQLSWGIARKSLSRANQRVTTGTGMRIS